MVIDCDRTLEALWTEPVRPAALQAHLASCEACSLAAERSAWLDQRLPHAVLMQPPPAVLARALAAARAAAPAAHQPVTRGESLPTYLLAGAVLVLAASLLAGWYQLLSHLAAEIAASLWLVVTSPALWFLPNPTELWGTMIGWFGAGVLAWWLRTLLVERESDDRSRAR